MEYYYNKKGKRIGPVEEQEIQTLINKGDLDRESKIWCSSYSDWKEISESDFDLSRLSPPPLIGDSINNSYLWILAFAPYIGIVLEYAFAYSFNSSDLIAEQNVENGEYWFITVAVNICISWLDERQLNRAGHDTSKFKGWIWLVPVYIYVRSKRTKVNWVPFIIWIILFLLMIV